MGSYRNSPTLKIFMEMQSLLNSTSGSVKLEMTKNKVLGKQLKAVTQPAVTQPAVTQPAVTHLYTSRWQLYTMWIIRKER